MLSLIFGPKPWLEKWSSNDLRRLPPTSVGEADLGGRLALLGPLGRNVPGKYGPHGELFFFLIQKEPAPMPGSQNLQPFLHC